MRDNILKRGREGGGREDERRKRGGEGKGREIEVMKLSPLRADSVRSFLNVVQRGGREEGKKGRRKEGWRKWKEGSGEEIMERLWKGNERSHDRRVGRKEEEEGK